LKTGFYGRYTKALWQLDAGRLLLQEVADERRSMNERHFEFWPKRMPRTLTLPKTSVLYNLKVSADR